LALGRFAGSLVSRRRVSAGVSGFPECGPTSARRRLGHPAYRRPPSGAAVCRDASQEHPRRLACPRWRPPSALPRRPNAAHRARREGGRSERPEPATRHGAAPSADALGKAPHLLNSRVLNSAVRGKILRVRYRAVSCPQGAEVPMPPGHNARAQKTG
jgi:hypothetical protein